MLAGEPGAEDIVRSVIGLAQEVALLIDGVGECRLHGAVEVVCVRAKDLVNDADLAVREVVLAAPRLDARYAELEVEHLDPVAKALLELLKVWRIACESTDMLS